MSGGKTTRRPATPQQLTLIETAGREDAEAILQIQRLAYQSEAVLYQDWNLPPLTESLQELLAEFDRQLFLKATCGEPRHIVGAVRARLQDGTCFIGRLIVHPDFQRQGIGGMLMRQVEQRFPQARRFELFTGHRSDRNLSFYRHLGYVPFREQQLSDRVTLIFLEKIVA
jgi:ribosomal protein S18 acetylase RimI-like enzyme